MEEDSNIKINSLKVDGGACMNNYLMQFQADILNCEVTRPKIVESTAMGAGYLAGLKSDIWDINKIKSNQEIDITFSPQIKDERRNILYDGWRDAVKRTFNWVKK